MGQSRYIFAHFWAYTSKPIFPLVQVRIFLKIPFLFGFLEFCTNFFFREHFYRFYSLILLFCKLCECDANVVSCAMTSIKKILYRYHRYFCYKVSIVSILFSCTFFLFFYVRLWFRMMDNLFFVEKNLIKVSCVPWKDFLLFFESKKVLGYTTLSDEWWPRANFKLIIISN